MTKEYLSSFPKLVGEWHQKKNGNKKLEDFTSGSGVSVWWLCPEKHEYEQKIRDRAKRSRGCPYCAGKRVTPESSFAAHNPDKLHLWHPSKNGVKKPNEYLPKSNKELWWKCKLGHEWKQRIAHISNGIGCPYCAGQRVTPDNSFAAHNPDKLHLWHPSKNGVKKPTDFTHGSDKKVWWKCEVGHEWKARIANISKGKGCPKCNNIDAGTRQVERGIKNKGTVLEKHPELQNEWHKNKNTGLSLAEIGVGSTLKVWWICSQGHEWQAKIRERCNGTGCPKCVPHISKLELRISTELEVVFGEIKTQVPFDKFEVDIVIPKIKLAIEVDGYPWHAGNEDRDILKSRSIDDAGYELLRLRDERLQSISGNEVVFEKRETPISIIKKTLLRIGEMFNLSDLQYGKIEKYLLSSHYINDSSYRKKLATIFVSDKSKSLENFKSLLTEWNYEKNDPLTPANFSKGSNKKLWWVCNEGHEWQATIVSRTNRGSGCNICAKARVGEKYKANAVSKSGSLFDKFPEIANEWHPTKNMPVTSHDRSGGSQEKVWWKCEEGHEWKAMINSRTRGNGCPFCYKNRKRKSTPSPRS